MKGVRICPRPIQIFHIHLVCRKLSVTIFIEIIRKFQHISHTQKKNKHQEHIWTDLLKSIQRTFEKLKFASKKG